MTKRLRNSGEFCWINMLTPDPKAACRFFGELLGWTFFEMPGMGFGVKVGESNVGGLFDLHGPQTPPGLPPYIGVMVKVESVDATVERVRALGGTIGRTMDVPNAGRMAVVYDPNGAELDVWEPRPMPGTDVDPMLPGAPSWFENLTTDVARATRFYSELFGWTAEAAPMGAHGYTSFKLGSDFVAGMMAIQPEMGPLKPHWGTYFTVRDPDATVSLATKLGGTVFVPPKDIPQVGRFAGIASPGGVPFYVIRYAQR